MTSKGTLNRVMLIGNFGANPELRTLPDGIAVSNFSIATTETWVDKNNPGERKEQTEWHRVTFFGRMAEILHEHGRKGGKIYIEGILRTRKWKDKDGIERYTTEVRGRDFAFLSSPNNAKRNDYEEFKGNNTNESYSDEGGLIEEDIPF